MISALEREFLQESNEIEGVWDAGSLDQAIVAWEWLIGQKRLKAGAVLKTHKLLMLNQPGLYPNEKGYFRTVPVFIAGRRCEVTSPEGWGLSELVSQWCFEANRTPDRWQSMHVDFERIHPFVDGNGRVGRMLMNWQRLKAGLEVIVIKADERQEYYKWFN